MKNFWEKLNKNFLCLAPMAGITDSAFRQTCKKFGACVVYSEMASVNALHYAPEKTLDMLKFDKIERPYVVQLFGSDPEFFKNAVEIVEKKIKPDGIDINFGCPVPKIAKQKAGAELGKDLLQSRKVIKAVLSSTKLPVSVKIRKQVGDVSAIDFLDNIKDLDVKAVMIHGRALSQMHSGPVDSDIIKKARNHFGGIIIANGGVNDKKSAEELFNKTKADGIGIAQGTLGKPWIFQEVKNNKLEIKSLDQVFKVVLDHAKLVEKNKGQKGIFEMRKHLCWYVQGFPGARKLREEFIKVESLEDIKKIIKKCK